jgi:hypothetical protein
MSVVGTKRTCRKVCYWAATGGKTDIQRIAPKDPGERNPANARAAEQLYYAVVHSYIREEARVRLERNAASLTY